MRERHVDDFVILQCDNMQQMPYRCKGCCFMLFDGLIWNCCVIISFTKESLHYQKFKENSVTLDKTICNLDVSALTNGYIFHFVNVFHCNEKLLKDYFLYHCVVNKYGNVEEMLKPSILKEVAPITEYMSRKEIRLWKKRKRDRVIHSLSDKSNVVKKRLRGKGWQSILHRTEVRKHTIYVHSNNKSACEKICKANKLEKSFHIIVPSPLFDRKEEEWITLGSGFKYCYREHFIIDVSYLRHLKKITNSTELHYSLHCFSVGSVKLIQPCDSHNTRFCIVTNEQFNSLRKKAGIKCIHTEYNSYLYEYSDKASWSLPGSVVSSWETHESLPEFTMKEVENLKNGVGDKVERRRTKNKGVYVTIGPRLSARPRPNPTIQEKNKLYFSDFYRQDWSSQEAMYLLRKKLCLG